MSTRPSASAVLARIRSLGIESPLSVFGRVKANAAETFSEQIAAAHASPLTDLDIKSALNRRETACPEAFMSEKELIDAHRNQGIEVIEFDAEDGALPAILRKMTGPEKLHWHYTRELPQRFKNVPGLWKLNGKTKP